MDATKTNGRKRNSRCRTESKISKVPPKDIQTDISKFLVKQQENQQSNYNSKLPDIAVPSLDNVSSDCKENCMKASKIYAENPVDNSKVISNDQSKDKVKKHQKQLTLSQNHQLTEYFPVRRSSRKTQSNTKKERQSVVEDAILSGKEEGFEIKEFPGKGRGVITKKHIKRGEFVLEYFGELIDYEEAKKREALYATKENTGCYMYYFKFRNKRFCIDATKETNRLGRLVNHSKKGNLKTQTFFIKECPHLVFLASRDIEPGEELSYDYGDRRKVAVESYPWLAL